ncbi:hypothetical protein OUZ56_026156 [Daphnia magna]|uniref:Endonuclease/exonuclease/phosphatase domain-containing protein n=1 Tax=Daphnia magna TaxID=35525 RepID=A0ABQ9ZL02_9CRUS|nr:hypothetical protein OUZ56_026156 [Daphnia magna]
MVPSETIALAFKDSLPTRVPLVALSFKVHTYYPSPFKCSKRWRLGHTKNRCNSKNQGCKTKLDHVTTETTRADKRIDTFEEKFANRFDRLERLLLTRLPGPKSDTENISSLDSESLISSHSKKNAHLQSQIHSRMDYMDTPASRHDVLLCETLWNNKFSVKSRTYHLINKNRTDRRGGGVAILVHRAIPYTEIASKITSNIEAIGVTIHNTKYGSIDIFSVYCPKGNCTKEELIQLSSTENHFIIGVDFTTS